MAAELVPKASVNGHIARDLARRLESSDPFDKNDPKFEFSYSHKVQPALPHHALEHRSHKDNQIMVCMGQFGAHDLKGALTGFFKVERLEKTAELDNQYLTENGIRCDADTWKEIERLPDTLCVHFERNYYDFEAQRMELNTRPVVYPKEIEFYDPAYRCFLTQTLADSTSLRTKKYSLAAVLVGRRRAPGDDFVVWWGYIRLPSCYKGEKWYEVDDWRALADYRTKGKPVSEETVMGHVRGGDDGGTFCIKLYYRNEHAEREDALMGSLAADYQY